MGSSVKVHSIIAVEGEGPIEQGADGVVKSSRRRYFGSGPGTSRLMLSRRSTSA